MDLLFTAGSFVLTTLQVYAMDIRAFYLGSKATTALHPRSRVL
jgi:hypothetical protein